MRTLATLLATAALATGTALTLASPASATVPQQCLACHDTADSNRVSPAAQHDDTTAVTLSSVAGLAGLGAVGSLVLYRRRRNTTTD